MNKTLTFLLAVFAAAGVTKADEITFLDRVERFAHARDWDGDEEKLAALVGEVPEHRNLIVSELENGDDDRVKGLLINLVSWSSDASMDWSETVNSLMPRFAETRQYVALLAGFDRLANSGNAKYEETISEFVDHENEKVRSAAKRSLKHLRSKLQSPIVVLQETPDDDGAHEEGAEATDRVVNSLERSADQEPPIEESPSFPKWALAVIVVAVLGIVILLIRAFLRGRAS